MNERPLSEQLVTLLNALTEASNRNSQHCLAALSDSSSALIVKIANLENELAALKVAKKAK